MASLHRAGRRKSEVIIQRCFFVSYSQLGVTSNQWKSNGVGLLRQYGYINEDGYKKWWPLSRNLTGWPRWTGDAVITRLLAPEPEARATPLHLHHCFCSSPSLLLLLLLLASACYTAVHNTGSLVWWKNSNRPTSARVKSSFLAYCEHCVFWEMGSNYSLTLK